MVNVGLRAYIWQQKSLEHQLHRELWGLTGNTYEGYRHFISNCKEYGFPPQHAQVFDRPPNNPTAVRSQSSASSLASTPSQMPTPFHFAGMQHVSEGKGIKATVLKFGRQDPELLAFGRQDGTVHVLSLGIAGEAGHQVLKQHRRAVSDLDWSLDDAFLLCVAEDGNISLWLTASAQLLRTFRTASAACCARFHMVNQNLILAGTASGAVQVFNSSTGKLVMKQMVCSSRLLSNSLSCVAMALSNNHVFIADSRGSIYSLRCNIKNGALQSLVLLTCTSPPNASHLQLGSLVYNPYSSLARGPALLTSALDRQLCLLKLTDAIAGQLDIVSVVQLPKAARKISATFCPTLHASEPEYMVSGAEDTNVYIYDVSVLPRQPVIVNVLEGHIAPVVDVSWNQEENLLASCDCDGTVIVWRRNRC